MSLKFIVVHRKDTNNVGDMASNPLQYFLQPDEYLSLDIVDIHKTAYPFNVPIIVGGGGLIGNDFMKDAVRHVLSSSDKNQLQHFFEAQQWILCNQGNKDLHEEFHEKFRDLVTDISEKLKENHARKFLWGVGHNGPLDKKSQDLEYPSWMLEFKLAGIRDYGQSTTWTPCASCMHPALQKEYEIKNKVIWFEHKKQLVKDFGQDPVPRFINSGNNIEQTIELLGSAEVILTNSYHGAYWGTLLKRKVIVVDAWSTKFFYMRHAPYILERGEDWKTAVEKAPIYPTALKECRAATEKFWRRIQSKL